MALVASKTLDRRFLISERLKEGIRKFGPVKGLLSKGGYRLFDLNGVHGRARKWVRIS